MAGVHIRGDVTKPEVSAQAPLEDVLPPKDVSNESEVEVGGRPGEVEVLESEGASVGGSTRESDRCLRVLDPF